MNRNVGIAIGALVGVVALGIAGLGAMVSMQPDQLVVERSVLIEATPARVQPEIADYKAFVAWSPWSGRDPTQVTTFSEPSSGVGAWYTWKGNDDVGSGKMSTTLVQPLRIEQDLEFYEPWAGQSKVIYELTPLDAGTQVTWRMEQPADFSLKAMTLFVDMDAMLGTDFEVGLNQLKERVESAPTDVAAAGGADGSEAGGMADEGADSEDTDHGSASDTDHGSERDGMGEDGEDGHE